MTIYHFDRNNNKNNNNNNIQGFEIKTNHSILARRRDFVLINKKRPRHQMDLAVSADHKDKQELESYQRAEEAVNHESGGDINFRTMLKILEKRLDKLEIRERIETIQATALLRSATLHKRVPEI